MTGKSKFKGLFDAAKERQLEEPEQPEQKEPNLVSSLPRRGRPKGKRSDPAFEQVTAYIRKETHQAVKIALLQDGQDKEFSELVEQLLQDWLQSRT